MLRRLSAVRGIGQVGVSCWVKVSVAALGGLILSSVPNTVLRSFSDLSMAKMATSNESLSAAFITCPNEEVARKLSRQIVEKNLAACVNIVPKVTSVYRWEGKVEEDSEALMMVKTKSDVIDSLIEFVKAHHPYDVPEVISVQLGQGNEAYMQWVRDSVLGPQSK